MREDKIFHIISNTHWDREWRFPFQRNRQMLVDMIDSVLDTLDNYPDYRAFHLDSQSVVLKDYIEIKPQNKERIKKLVENDRLLIGPWFILPEEFQVGGENLIRNLLMGHKVCSEFGGVSKIGYSPFSWGQISQLPQIYNQFNIEMIMFYRGVNSLDSDKAEFIWQGADGTKALTSRFSTMPRYNFYFYIYRPVVHNEEFSDLQKNWEEPGTPFHMADMEQYSEDYFILAPKNNYTKSNIEPQVKKIIKDQADDFRSPHVIWMEGHDSSGPNPETLQIINDIKEIFPSLKVKHSTLKEYAEAVKSSINYDELSLVKGERRSAQYDHRSGNLYGYTTSARMYLKQKNFDAERWLQYYAEPFNVFSALLGRDINDNYLETAWELLIKNSAHDSIGGCSLDRIHEDMMNRYKQIIEICEGVFERSVKHIAKNIDTSAFSDSKESDIFIHFLNTTNYTRDEVVYAVIDIPKAYNKGSIELRDAENNIVNYEILNTEEFQPVLEQMINRPLYYDMNRYKVLVDLTELKSFGLKSLKVIPIEEEKPSQTNLGRIENNLPILENEYLKVEVNKNGTFNLFNKLNGQAYNEQGYFYDEGDAGGAWVPEWLEPFVDTLNEAPEIRLLTSNSLKAEVEINHLVKIPKDLSARENKTGELAELPIELKISLDKYAKRLDMNIHLNNHAESHRLRIMFPTRLKAEYSWGEGQFDVPKRAIEKIDASDWVEQPMYDYPMHHFVDVSDGRNGAAVLVDGLKEYEVIGEKENTIAVTLFRAFEYKIIPSSYQDYSHQKGSQCLGEKFYRLSFYPHKGYWDEGKVFEEAMKFNYNIRAFQTGKTAGNLKPGISFLTIEPAELVFSALKKPEDALDNSYVLRLFNPTDKEISGTVNSMFPIEQVEKVTLEEKPEEKIKNENNSFNVTIGSKRIQTFKIKFRRNS